MFSTPKVPASSPSLRDASKYVHRTHVVSTYPRCGSFIPELNHQRFLRRLHLDTNEDNEPPEHKDGLGEHVTQGEDEQVAGSNSPEIDADAQWACINVNSSRIQVIGTSIRTHGMRYVVWAEWDPHNFKPRLASFEQHAARDELELYAMTERYSGAKLTTYDESALERELDLGVERVNLVGGKEVSTWSEEVRASVAHLHDLAVIEWHQDTPPRAEGEGQPRSQHVEGQSHSKPFATPSVAPASGLPTAAAVHDEPVEETKQSAQDKIVSPPEHFPSSALDPSMRASMENPVTPEMTLTMTVSTEKDLSAALAGFTERTVNAPGVDGHVLANDSHSSSSDDVTNMDSKQMVLLGTAGALLILFMVAFAIGMYCCIVCARRMSLSLSPKGRRRLRRSRGIHQVVPTYPSSRNTLPYASYAVLHVGDEFDELPSPRAKADSSLLNMLDAHLAQSRYQDIYHTRGQVSISSREVMHAEDNPERGAFVRSEVISLSL